MFTSTERQARSNDLEDQEATEEEPSRYSAMSMLPEAVKHRYSRRYVVYQFRLGT